MPNALWQPVIGSGPNAFSDIMGQQAGWSRFNVGVENQNLDRIAQAQNAQNQWLAQVANMQRQDAAREENLARQDQSDIQSQLDRAQAFGERAREFDIGTGLEKSKLDQEAKARDWHLAIRDADEKRQLDTVENTAKFLAKDAQDYASAFKDSAKELSDSTNEIDTTASKLQSPLIEWGKSKQFVPKLSINPSEFEGMSDSEKTAAYAAKKAEAERVAAEANAKLAAAKARHDQALENYRLRLSNWNDLKKRAAQNGLDIGDDGTVYSPYHDKKYGSPIKLDTAIAPAKEEPSITMPLWLNTQMPAELNNPWIGFSPGALASSMPAPAATQPLKIGRFLVTPQ